MDKREKTAARFRAAKTNGRSPLVGVLGAAHAFRADQPLNRTGRALRLSALSHPTLIGALSRYVRRIERCSGPGANPAALSECVSADDGRGTIPVARISVGTATCVRCVGKGSTADDRTKATARDVLFGLMCCRNYFCAAIRSGAAPDQSGRVLQVIRRFSRLLEYCGPARALLMAHLLADVAAEALRLRVDAEMAGRVNCPMRSQHRKLAPRRVTDASGFLLRLRGIEHLGCLLLFVAPEGAAVDANPVKIRAQLFAGDAGSGLNCFATVCRRSNSSRAPFRDRRRLDPKGVSKRGLGSQSLASVIQCFDVRCHESSIGGA